MEQGKTMRRLCWCGAAVIALVLAVGVTFVYAQRHPNSTLTRCALLVYRLGVEYIPLTPVARAAAERAAPVVEGVAEVVLPNSQTAQPELSDAPVQESCKAAYPAVAAQAGDFLRAQADLLSVDEDHGCCEEHGKGCCAGKGGQETVHKLCPAAEEGGAAEEAEDHPTTMPLTGDDKSGEPADMPYSKDDGSWWSHVMEFLKGAGSKAQTPAAGPDVPDGSATVHPGAPAKCQEDSAYPYQDPGCPYPGARPAHPGKPAAVPQTQGGAEEQSVPPAKPSAHKTGRAMNDEGCEECPPHPEVDTMEFRPSDARPGEFDPQPM
jgi:hypothetical protein